MAYATIDDMVARYGQAEMIRLTTPADQDMVAIVAATAETALATASAIMDSYIGRRYRTPMDLAPPVVVAKCCDLARFELSTGDQKSPSDEVRARAKDARDWLRDIADGRVVLELEEVAAGAESYARASTRDDACAPYGRGVF